MARPVRTHTFRLGKYTMREENGLLGMCDMPEDGSKGMELVYLQGNTRQALAVLIHEAMHAEGIPDRYIDKGGDDSAERIADIAWRLGWRRTK